MKLLSSRDRLHQNFETQLICDSLQHATHFYVISLILSSGMGFVPFLTDCSEMTIMT